MCTTSTQTLLVSTVLEGKFLQKELSLYLFCSTNKNTHSTLFNKTIEVISNKTSTPPSVNAHEQ